MAASPAVAPKVSAAPLPVALTAQAVLSRYATALGTVKPPAAYAFEYFFEHRGDRPQDRRDRVYRQGDHERVEILAVNGERLAHPQVQIYQAHRDRYAVAAIAPAPTSYAFTYVGPQLAGRHNDYVFDVTPRAPGTLVYVVTQVTIDGTTFLPRKVTFVTRTERTDGSGEVTYAKSDQYWVPTSAVARARVAGNLQSERISWSRYRFFSSLPPSTFAQPRPAPTFTPA